MDTAIENYSHLAIFTRSTLAEQTTPTMHLIDATWLASRGFWMFLEGIEGCHPVTLFLLKCSDRSQEMFSTGSKMQMCQHGQQGSGCLMGTLYRPNAPVHSRYPLSLCCGITWCDEDMVASVSNIRQGIEHANLQIEDTKNFNSTILRSTTICSVQQDHTHS